MIIVFSANETIQSFRVEKLISYIISSILYSWSVPGK